MVMMEELKKEMLVLGEKLVEVGKKLEQRLERLESRFDLVEEGLDDVEDFLHCLEERIMEMDDHTIDLQEQLERIENSLCSKIAEIQDSMVQFEENFRAMLCICADQGLKLEKLEYKVKLKDFTHPKSG